MSRFLSCCLLVVATVSGLVASQASSSFREIRQTYCDAGNLCLTSFDWCQSGPQYSSIENVTTGYCERPGTAVLGEGQFLYSPTVGTTAGMAAFMWPFYNLTWSGADANYPVQVDFSFGPDEGPVNNTAPLWSQNVTEPYLNFRFRDIFDDLSDQDADSNVSYYGYGLGWPAYFTISQPERPPVEGINTTDQSNLFTISNLDIDYLNRQYEDEFDMAQDRQHRRWSLGVGIGVGLGVPILLIATYILGRFRGKKAAGKIAKKGVDHGKENSELSDGDRSAPKL